MCNKVAMRTAFSDGPRGSATLSELGFDAQTHKVKRFLLVRATVLSVTERASSELERP
jgi:hypothetical protein